MINSPQRIIRQLLGQYLTQPDPYDGPGLYVIACYPSLGCLYVGRANGGYYNWAGSGVYRRIREHLANDDMIGTLLRSQMADACLFGIDILVPPENEDLETWLYQAEQALIGRFMPCCNTQGRA